MEDGRLPISNNLCEANIKPFATARRARLFADTPKGAKANAILYTLVESARANKLNAFEYLKYLLTEIPNSRYLEQPECNEEVDSSQEANKGKTNEEFFKVLIIALTEDVNFSVYREKFLTVKIRYVVCFTLYSSPCGIVVYTLFTTYNLFLIFLSTLAHEVRIRN